MHSLNIFQQERIVQVFSHPTYVSSLDSVDSIHRFELLSYISPEVGSGITEIEPNPGISFSRSRSVLDSMKIVIYNRTKSIDNVESR